MLVKEPLAWNYWKEGHWGGSTCNDRKDHWVGHNGSEGHWAGTNDRKNPS